MEKEAMIGSGQSERWRICTIAAQDEGGQRVLLPSLQTMAMFHQIQGMTSTVKITPPERTRYIVEVKVAGKVVERIEAAVLYVRRSAKKLILERTGGPPEARLAKGGPEDLVQAATSSPSATTDPEMPVRDTVSDEPLIKPPTKRPAEGEVRQRRPTDWDQLPDKVKKILADEAQVRGAVYVRFANGEAWAERFITFLFGDKLEEGKTITEQRSILRRHFDLSAKLLIERIVKAPVGDAAAEAHRTVLLELLEEIAASGGPAASWAEQLHQKAVEMKREAVPQAQKQIGVTSGKFPSAKRAVELLRGKSRHIGEALTMLNDLVGMKHYRDVAANSADERRALADAVKIITAATQKQQPAFDDTIQADLRRIRVTAADHGLVKVQSTAKEIEKIRTEAEQRSKDKK